jgi:hypothetical protein
MNGLDGQAIPKFIHRLEAFLRLRLDGRNVRDMVGPLLTPRCLAWSSPAPCTWVPARHTTLVVIALVRLTRPQGLASAPSPLGRVQPVVVRHGAPNEPHFDPLAQPRQPPVTMPFIPAGPGR